MSVNVLLLCARRLVHWSFIGLKEAICVFSSFFVSHEWLQLKGSAALFMRHTFQEATGFS